MSFFLWSPEKNDKLLKTRNISFEDIVLNIDQGGLLDVLENPNQTKYPHQKILVVKVQDYVCYVPYLIKEIAVFLLTIIPSRKLTKKYLKNE